MTRNRTGLKQIAFDVPEHWHEDIKMRAASKNMSMKDWILIAMAEQILKERELE